jgi:hypothetical protein
MLRSLRAFGDVFLAQTIYYRFKSLVVSVLRLFSGSEKGKELLENSDFLYVLSFVSNAKYN